MVSVTVVVPTVIPVPVSLMVSAVIPVPMSFMMSAVIPVPMSFMMSAVIPASMPVPMFECILVFGYFSALICQMEKSIFIHYKKAAIPQKSYRMADTRLTESHVPGKVYGAHRTFFHLPLQYQHSFQIVLA